MPTDVTETCRDGLQQGFRERAHLRPCSSQERAGSARALCPRPWSARWQASGAWRARLCGWWLLMFTLDVKSDTFHYSNKPITGSTNSVFKEVFSLKM